MTLRKKLCARFCSYYKPSKDEDLACMGYLAVERLVGAGRKIRFQKTGGPRTPSTEKTLISVVCGPCPFRKEDCDFIAKAGDAPPCGGFILLCQLLDAGALCVDDLRDKD